MITLCSLHKNVAVSDHRTPCAENDIINVLNEPYFGAHIWGNSLPFQTFDIPKKNALISVRGPVIRKVKVSRHSFRVSLRQTLTWVGSKPKFTIMICDFVCNVCGKQFKSKKTLTQHNRDVHIELDVPCSSSSDEVVEQAHYRVNAFERIHGYLGSDRKMQTPNAAEKQQRMMEHLNSHHLR